MKLASDERGQMSGGGAASIATVLIVFMVVGVVGFEVVTMRDDPSMMCESELGEGAEYINDSDNTFDCRAPNGTVVENVTIEIQSNRGVTTVNPAEWEIEG